MSDLDPAIMDQFYMKDGVSASDVTRVSRHYVCVCTSLTVCSVMSTVIRTQRPSGDSGKFVENLIRPGLDMSRTERLMLTGFSCFDTDEWNS